ncbi:MAG: TetR/AcrR family transcriptional regulator C-terminal domain-containing protein, partial [Acidimicrobiales bacterium]
AVGLFVERGLGGVSVKAIADAADVFPSQLTYYFGSKDALFVEAACREVLHIGTAVEKAGSGATSPSGYVEAIVQSALDAPSLLLFAEAMSVARFNPDLQSRIEQTLERLYAEGARAVSEVCCAHGWMLTTPAEVEARAFWSTVIGVALQQAATASHPDPATAQAVISLFFTLHPEVSP